MQRESSAVPRVLDAAGWRALFAHEVAFTIGLEEELMLVDPGTLDLVPRAEEVLSRIDPGSRVTLEMPAAHLEIVTRPHTGVAAAVREIAVGRCQIAQAAAGLARPLASGTHPFAAAEGEMHDGPRYTRVLQEYRGAVRRALCCGLHVHVAVPGADRALAVFNAMRSYLPELLALSANAPFHEGRDTGLATIRPQLHDALPRQGVPPALESWEALAEHLQWGQAAIPDPADLWWELRPHARFGTLELRVADTQTRLHDVAAVAAVSQCLAAWLAERHDAGEDLPVAATERIEENRWLALRHGLDAELLDLRTGHGAPARERLRALLGVLRPVAVRLGCAHELAFAHSLLRANGAERQRAIAARGGPTGLVARLADDYLRDVPAPARPADGRASVRAGRFTRAGSRLAAAVTGR